MLPRGGGGATRVPVSVTALLCSPSLTWEAALSCYYAFQSEPSLGDATCSPARRRRAAAAAATDNDTRTREGASTHPHYAVATSPPRAERQQRLRQRVAMCEREEEEVKRGVSPAATHTTAPDERGTPRVTLEAVFYLHHRLQQTNAAAYPFLLHACRHDPLLAPIRKELEATTAEASRSQTATRTTTRMVRSSLVLSTGLAHLLDAAAGQGSDTGEDAMAQLWRVARHCQAFGLTRLYVQDVVQARRSPDVALRATSLPAVPCFSVLLHDLLRRWEGALRVLRKESLPRPTLQGGTRRVSGSRSTGTGASRVAGTHPVSDGDSGTMAAVEAARMHFADAPEAEAAAEEAAGPLALSDRRGAQAVIRELVGDSVVAIPFVAQLRLCRQATAAAAAAEEESVEESHEGEALRALVLRAAPHCGFGDLLHVLSSVAETERCLLVEEGSVGDPPSCCAVAMARDAAPLLQLLVTRAIHAAATPCEVRRAVEAVGGCCPREEEGDSPLPAATASRFLPPLSCCPDVLRAMTTGPHRSGTLTEEEAAAAAWPSLLLALYTSDNAAAGWSELFFGSATTSADGVVVVAAAAGKRCASHLSAPFPRDLRGVSDRFQVPPSRLVDQWSEGCVVLSQWLGRQLSARCTTQVLAHATAGLCRDAAVHDGAGGELRGSQRVVREVVLGEFLPSLASRAERAAALSESLRLLSPARADEGIHGDDATPARVRLLRALLTTPRAELRNDQGSVPPATTPLVVGGGAAIAASPDGSDAVGEEEATEAAASLLLDIFRTCGGGGAWSLAEAALLLRHTLEAVEEGVPCLDQPRLRARLVEAFCESVNANGLRLERATTSPPSKGRDEATDDERVAEAESWVGLLVHLPRGVADEAHVTLWLYWMMRAVTQAEGDGEGVAHSLLLLPTGGSHRTTTAATTAQVTQHSAEYPSPQLVRPQQPAAVDGGRRRVCGEHDAISLARNMGSHLADFPRDAVAPPMLLNWLVARVPRLSWSEAARVLLGRSLSDAGGPGAALQSGMGPVFVYLTLPVDHVQDMQHALRVLGSLRHAYRDPFTGPPFREHELTRLYASIRGGLLSMWCHRSLYAVLAFVAENPKKRATAAPAAAAAVDTSSEELSRLLRACQSIRGAHMDALPTAATSASPAHVADGASRIRIPLSLLAFFLLQERYMHGRLLEVSEGHPWPSAPAAAGSDGPRSSGLSSYLASKLLRGMQHVLGDARTETGAQLPPLGRTQVPPLPTAVLPETELSLVKPFFHFTDAMQHSSSLHGARGEDGENCGDEDGWWRGVPAAAPVSDLPPLDSRLSELFAAIAQQVAREATEADDSGQATRSTDEEEPAD